MPGALNRNLLIGGLLALSAVGCGPDFKLTLINIPIEADTLYILTRTDVRNSSGQIVDSQVSKPKQQNIKGLSATQRAGYSYGLSLDGAPTAASGQTRATTVSVAATQGSKVLRIGETEPVVMDTTFIDLQIGFDTLRIPPRPDVGKVDLNSGMFMTQALRWLTLDEMLQPMLVVDIIGWNFPKDVVATLSIINCSATLVTRTRYSSPSTIKLEGRQQPAQPFPPCVIDLINNPMGTQLKISLSNEAGTEKDEWTQGGPPPM